MLSNLRQRIGSARDAIETRARDVWRRDRAPLRGWSACKNRVLRIGTFAVRGVSVHQLGLQAAALTYYTAFSLVPLLVVVLGILRIFDGRLAAEPAMPLAGEITRGNAALHAMLARLLENVNHTSQVTGGIVGLIALVYAVVRLFAYTERALDHIASSTTRKPKLSRLFSYVALLVLPPLLGIIVGPLLGAAHHDGLGGRHRSPVRLRRLAEARHCRRPGLLRRSGWPLPSSIRPLRAPGSRSPRRRWARRWPPSCWCWCSGRSPGFRSGCRAETAFNSARPRGRSFSSGRSPPGSWCCSAPRSPSATASTGS